MITTSYKIIHDIPHTQKSYDLLSLQAYCAENNLSVDNIVIEEIETNKLNYLNNTFGVAYEIPSVTASQLRQALILQGVSPDMVTAALNTLPEPQKTLALSVWEYETIHKRNTELTSGVGQLLGWSEIMIDDLWTYAGTL